MHSRVWLPFPISNVKFKSWVVNLLGTLYNVFKELLGGKIDYFIKS